MEKYLINTASSVEGLSVCKDSEKMKNVRADKMHLLPAPLHVRICWGSFNFNRSLQNNNVQFVYRLTNIVLELANIHIGWTSEVDPAKKKKNHFI